jgi:hypothetical protein
MPTILLKNEALPIEVGDMVYWVKLETRKIQKGSAEPVIQYWAFLPPGMRPATLRGKDRSALVEEVRQAIVAQTNQS